METKINIAESLKDCPKGMKLYSPIFGDVYLDKIRPHLAIMVTTDKEQGDFKEEFLYDGRYGMNGECMLFPSKENRDWSTFHKPFKDGDIIYVCDEYSDAKFTYVAILKQIEKGEKIQSHCFYNFEDDYFSTHDFLYDGHNTRFATEKEKEKLFKAIKDNGYKWNPETKTLEKLVEPKFKVGDKIQWCGPNYMPIRIIKSIEYDRYILDNTNYIKFENENNFKLIKFDITTLKPFDKVLVRCNLSEKWHIDFFEVYNRRDGHPFTCLHNNRYNQCIPYKGNEHLLDTTNDCDEYYKTWK